MTKNPWCAVYANERKIFEGFANECERLVKNLRNSERGIFMGDFTIKPAPIKTLRKKG